MSQGHRITVLGGIALLIFSFQLWAAPPPPSVNQCKSKWTLTSAQSLAFGAFSIESGNGTLQMDSSGALTTPVNINTSTANPVTTFTVTVNNTKDPTVCGTYGFDLSWGVAPAPLAGPGTAMLLTNVLVSEPTIPMLNSPTALPITGITTANLPITLTFQGDLAATFPQAAGLYTSPAYTLDLTQSGTVTSVSSTATATSLTPLSVLETVAMNFGDVYGGSSAGTVIVTTVPGVSATGGAGFVGGTGATPATFTINGAVNTAIAVTLTTAGAQLDDGGGGAVMALSTFTNTALPVTTDGSGAATFDVGASLNVGPSQPAGVYSTATGVGAPYAVTVNYN